MALARDQLSEIDPLQMIGQGTSCRWDGGVLALRHSNGQVPTGWEVMIVSRSLIQPCLGPELAYSIMAYYGLRDGCSRTAKNAHGDKPGLYTEPYSGMEKAPYSLGRTARADLRVHVGVTLAKKCLFLSPPGFWLVKPPLKIGTNSNIRPALSRLYGNAHGLCHSDSYDDRDLSFRFSASCLFSPYLSYSVIFRYFNYPDCSANASFQIRCFFRNG